MIFLGSGNLGNGAAGGGGSSSDTGGDGGSGNQSVDLPPCVGLQMTGCTALLGQISVTGTPISTPTSGIGNDIALQCAINPYQCGILFAPFNNSLFGRAHAIYEPTYVLVALTDLIFAEDNYDYKNLIALDQVGYTAINRANSGNSQFGSTILGNIYSGAYASVGGTQWDLTADPSALTGPDVALTRPRMKPRKAISTAQIGIRVRCGCGRLGFRMITG